MSVKLEREEMVAGLKSAFVEVVFEKVNGDECVLKCTLNPEYLPEMDESKEASSKPVNLSVVNVWDVDLKDWRSFRVDSVLEFNVLKLV